MSEAEWIRFVQLTSGGKTTIWDVVSNDTGQTIGLVKWFGRWWCYAFFPQPNTVFERKCLRDIAEFCESQTAEHRNKKLAERAK